MVLPEQLSWLWWEEGRLEPFCLCAKNSMCLCLGKWSLCLGVCVCVNMSGHACTNEHSSGFFWRSCDIGACVCEKEGRHNGLSGRRGGHGRTQLFDIPAPVGGPASYLLVCVFNKHAHISAAKQPQQNKDDNKRNQKCKLSVLNKRKVG